MSGPRILVADAFGELVDVDYTVVFVGRDERRKPTLGYGAVEEVLPDKVMVRRELRSSRKSHGDRIECAVRRVWVEPWKVAVVGRPGKKAAA